MMKKTILFLLLVTFLPGPVAQSYTKEERMYWLSMLWKDASSKFHNPEHLRQVNWGGNQHDPYSNDV
jgi:hypothetical protein